MRKLVPYRNLRPYLAKVLDLFDENQMSATPRRLANQNYAMLSDLGERVFAVESLAFVFDHLKFAKFRLTSCLSENDLPIALDFFDKADKTLKELREFVFKNYLPKTLKSGDNFFTAIPLVKWEVKDMSGELTNIYTETLINVIERVVYHLKDFKEKLESLAGGSIPKRIQKDLLAKMCIFCFKLLVDSFSRVRKINDKGKEMMSSDFTLIVSGVKGFFEEGKIPFQDFVEDYIGAIFLPAEDIPEFFIKNKIRYQLRIMDSLFFLNSNLSKLGKSTQKEMKAKIEKPFIELLKQN